MFAQLSEHHSFPKHILGTAKTDKPFGLFEEKVWFYQLRTSTY